MNTTKAIDRWDELRRYLEQDHAGKADRDQYAATHACIILDDIFNGTAFDFRAQKRMFAAWRARQNVNGVTPGDRPPD